MFGSSKHNTLLRHPGYNKKDSAPPDYAPMAAASERAAQLGYDLGNAQLEFSKQQYTDMKPLFDQIVGSQIETQNQTNAQGADYYNYLKGTYRPLEQGLVADAQQFNQADYREQLAAKAAADAGRAFTTNQGALSRSMASMGVNPNSGRFASLSNQNALGLAAQRAGAMTGTRQQADAMGWAKRMDAAGLGRNLAGASNAAYQVGLSAGNSAGQNAMAPGNQYMAGMSAGNGTIMQGSGQQIQGLGSILSAQGNYANAAMNANGEFGGAVLGAVGRLGAAALSDRRLKENIELVGVDEKTGLNLYEFNYLTDKEHRFRGVMADEVKEVMPQAVIEDHLGFMAVNYDMLGIEMVEV